MVQVQEAVIWEEPLRDLKVGYTTLSNGPEWVILIKTRSLALRVTIRQEF